MRDNPTGVTAGATICIDFDAVKGLAVQLHELAQQVSDRGAIVQPGLDSDLFGKLTTVENDWSTHRRQLQSFLSETARSIDQIVAEYEKTNDMIASASARG